MKIHKQSLAGVRRSFSCVLLLLLFTGFVFQVQAQIYSYTNLNSVVKLDVGSSTGLFSWEVDGVDQVNQQWFYYRIGDTGPEYAINTIGTAAVTNTDARTWSVSYANSSLSVTLNYLLTGNDAGSGKSSMVLSFGVKNLSSAASSIHFFQYSDYDLNVAHQNDLVRVSIGGPPKYAFNKVIQTAGSMGLTNTITSGNPNRVQVAVNDQTLFGLTDGNPTTLNNVTNAVSGNLTYAMQWDASLAANGSFVVVELISLKVPEPSCLALVASGILAFSFICRRR